MHVESHKRPITWTMNHMNVPWHAHSMTQPFNQTKTRFQVRILVNKPLVSISAYRVSMLRLPRWCSSVLCKGIAAMRHTRFSFVLHPAQAFVNSLRFEDVKSISCYINSSEQAWHSEYWRPQGWPSFSEIIFGISEAGRIGVKFGIF